MLEQEGVRAQTLVVVGAGLTGWLVAAACAVTLGKAARIIVVGEEDDPEFFQIATAGRRFCEFNKLLRFPEEVFMAATGAYFRLGSEIKTEDGSQRISVGQIGKGAWLAPFYHFWLRAKSFGIASPLLDYCVEGVGAMEGKYSILPNYPSKHGYQFDVHEYTSRIKELALGLGVQYKNCGLKSNGVVISEAGIQTLELLSEERVFGDIFVDCSGALAELIGKVSDEPRESWSHWLPEDRLAAVYQELRSAPSLLTPESQNSVGRTFRLFSQRGHLHVQAYSRNKNTTEDALAHLQHVLKSGGSIKHQNVMPGVFKKMWIKNCVAVGSSAGYVDYHEPTQLQLIFRGILRLLAHFPSGKDYSFSADSFNREMARELEAMRDFMILRQSVTNMPCNRLDIPSSLQRRIALFQESGFIECRDDELFREDYWAQMFLLANVIPRHPHPVALNMDESVIKEKLTTIHQDVRKVVGSFSNHVAFIEGISRLRSKTLASDQEWRMPSKPILGGKNSISGDVEVKTVGFSKTPVITVDNVGLDWIDSLRQYTRNLNFLPDRNNYYPGTRCNLPNQYVMAIMSVVAKLVSDVYQIPRNLTPNISKASFSLVTQPEQTLATAQCIPHFDTTKPYSYAILHYLSPGEHGHTGFFRHLPTGFECLSAENQQLYISEIDRYFDSHGQPKKQYMRAGNDHFELVDHIIYQQHRLAIYPSNLIHSAMIVPEKDVDSDPMKGRLTANIFLEFNP